MKRVFMISSYSLFGEGVEALLRQECGIECVGREADVDLAMARIKELCPDVVVVDNGCPARDAAAIVTRIFQEQAETRVVGLNLQDNTICIYHGEQRTVHGIEDLKKAIGNESSGQLAPEGGLAKEEN
jgi:DNA-binding NarL/FixJ family response regulator